ncbi:coproporphyrinogen oxidase [Spirosomataceae bacterium TFI 002]|nr:coproporphyrinogen oxidase [Spirosomataceae bacterium TFI 002]
MPNKEEIIAYFKSLQNSICTALEAEDGKGKFKEDAWQHHAGGGGLSRVITDGNVIEKGGVNFSAVEGVLTAAMQKQLKIEDDCNFIATGVSIVIHPNNPKVPIIHMNVRYFELSNGTYWFGGGIDLTPHFIDQPQAKWFHEQLKNACDASDGTMYPNFKTWADDYFFIPHRNETRGVGGIFFDHLNPDKKEKHNLSTKRNIFDFVKAVGNSFAPIYTHLMHVNKDKSFTEAEKHWQLIRRGRYAEFNLVWDRGTKFGLVTNGRTESILMSLPPQANWEYDYQAVEGSEEQKTLDLLKKGIDWVNS